jgi:hypothetical protein
MAVRHHPTSLMALLVEVQIEITGHLAATLEQPMDDLCSLRAMRSSMRDIYGDPAIGQCVAVDRCRHGARSSNDLINYFTLLASLIQVDNLEACFLTGIQIVFAENHSPPPCLDYLTHTADGGHNVVAFLVAIFLYRHNGDACYDNTARWYIRRVEGKEDSWAAATDQ